MSRGRFGFSVFGPSCRVLSPKVIGGRREGIPGGRNRKWGNWIHHGIVLLVSFVLVIDCVLLCYCKAISSRMQQAMDFVLLQSGSCSQKSQLVKINDFKHNRNAGSPYVIFVFRNRQSKNITLPLVIHTQRKRLYLLFFLIL